MVEHMFSILVACSQLPPISYTHTGQIADVMSLTGKSFLPTYDDVERVKGNLAVLVSWFPTKYMYMYFKSLSPLSKAVPQHISHQYSAQMSKKSEVVVLDVLMKNEVEASDMLDIMHTVQAYLGKCLVARWIAQWTNTDIPFSGGRHGQSIAWKHQCFPLAKCTLLHTCNTWMNQPSLCQQSRKQSMFWMGKPIVRSGAYHSIPTRVGQGSRLEELSKAQQQEKSQSLWICCLL